MKIVVDTHIHTLSSGHAYSTVVENANIAAEKGLDMIAITDHGPSMEGAPSFVHFTNLRVLPERINNVRILKGIEANIIDYDGKLDLRNKQLEKLDFVIASFHEMCIEPITANLHTNALIGVLKNPYVDAIGHPGNPIFEVDIEKVVLAAKEYGKFIELNNHSFNVRKGSEENCYLFATLCKKYEVKVVIGSDAHICYDVGNFSNVYKILEEVNMPEELVMSCSASNFEKYLIDRRLRMPQN